MTILLPSGYDDTAIVQEAINDEGASTGGGEVKLGAGGFNISSCLSIGNGNQGNIPSTINGLRLRGRGGGFAGDPLTVLNWVGQQDTPMAFLKGRASDIHISDMFFAMNGTSSGLIANSFSNCTFKGLKFANPGTGCIALGLFGGGAPTGNYNIFNEFRRISIGLFSPGSIGLYMDGAYAPVMNDTWLTSFDLVRVETVAGATNAACAWIKFADSCTFRRCHIDPSPEPTARGLILDAIGHHEYPGGMAFYDCSIGRTTVIESSTDKIRKCYFYGFGTADNEVVPSHPMLAGITDTGRVFGDFPLTRV